MRSQIAFRQAGFIAEIIAKPGTQLKAGEPLATLDARDFKLRQALAKARTEQAKIQADAASKDYQRETALQKENASTSASLDRTKAAFDSAQLALRLAELDLESADLGVKDTRLLAPYDCVVATQMKHEGENVQSGTAVFEVYGTGTPELRFGIPERMINMISVGSELAITIPSAGVESIGKVIRMVPVISEKSRTFEITAMLGESAPRPVPGSYAEAVLKK
jgi:RND family efflux transporter MFP subunit